MNKFDGTNPEAQPEFQRIVLEVKHKDSDELVLQEYDVPTAVNVDVAIAEWVGTGGQVRTFSIGAGGANEIRTLSFPDWLVSERGARIVTTAEQPEAA